MCPPITSCLSSFSLNPLRALFNFCKSPNTGMSTLGIFYLIVISVQSSLKKLKTLNVRQILNDKQAQEDCLPGWGQVYWDVKVKQAHAGSYVDNTSCPIDYGKKNQVKFVFILFPFKKEMLLLTLLRNEKRDMLKLLNEHSLAMLLTCLYQSTFITQ